MLNFSFSVLWVKEGKKPILVGNDMREVNDLHFWVNYHTLEAHRTQY